MSNFFTKDKANRGFTLIELLVVIAIIGVLASIVLASLNNARRKSRDARRVTDIKQLQLALELYFDGVGAGQYPASSATCDATANARGLEVLQTGGYIPQIPRDPLSTTDCYAYASPASGARTTYHIGVSLEDPANSALNGDKDCNSTGTPANCPISAAYSNGFNGGSAAAESTQSCLGSDTTKRCYDVVP